MRSLDEKFYEIKKREARLRYKKNIKTVGLLSCLSTVMFVFIVYLAAKLSPSGFKNSFPSVFYGAAISQHPVLGLVSIILLSFLLGVCVTIICLKLKNEKN